MRNMPLQSRMYGNKEEEKEKMNPRCPKCGAIMYIKFRTYTDKLTGKQGGTKYWECPHCKKRYKAGAVNLKCVSQ